MAIVQSEPIMKNTQKYRLALQISNIKHDHQDILYEELNKLGYYWDSKIKQWVKYEGESQQPLEGLKIRLWSDQKDMDEYSSLIKEICQAHGLKLLESSKPYPCRHPQEQEVRVYLYFIKEDKKNK